MKEPEIMLFGKKISLPESCVDSAGSEYSGEYSDEGGSHQKPDKSDEDQTSSNSGTITDQEDAVAVDQRQSPPGSTKKTLKKPDKILPCPRCNSKDTKFCYYNNYNVNQPRHFCRGCQRYWTAGGTMRHIPVGSGRRKNKNSTASHHFHGYNNHHQPKFKIVSFRPDNHRIPPNGPSFSCKNKEKVDDSKHCNNGVFQAPFCSSGVMWPISAILYPSGYPIPVWNPLLQDDANLSSSSHNSPLGNKQSKETSLVVPKTLRIDDPEEAAKSPIWATLGIKYDRVRREDMFKSLQPKKDAACITDSSPLLQANPAALSRSVRFQESV